MGNEPKISTAEAILWIIICLIADVVSIIPVINWVVWIIMAPAVWMYFKAKGVQSKYAVIGSIIEIIPVVSALPGYTTEMLVAVYMDRHPKIAAVANHYAGNATMKIRKERGAIAANNAANTENAPAKYQKPAEQPAQQKQVKYEYEAAENE